MSSVEGAALFLGDTTLTRKATGTTVYGTRSFAGANGIPVAERSANTGVTGSVVTWLFADVTGTVDTRSVATSGATQQTFRDPFGGPLGGAASFWDNGNGYLDKPGTASTGLTTVGARLYSPLLGKFLSVDPITDPGNPQQNTGYAYGWNNPLTHPDPTGLEPRPWHEGRADKGGLRPSTSTPTRVANQPSANAPGTSPVKRSTVPQRATHGLPGCFGGFRWCIPVPVPTTTAPKPKPKPYGYTFTYPLPMNGRSDRQAWRAVNNSLRVLFPIPGMVDNPQKGDKIDLIGNPVDVTEISSTSLTLTSQQGHTEGAGNVIIFAITEGDLTVSASGPREAPWPQNQIPNVVWPLLAYNVRTKLDPGSEYSGLMGWK